MKNVNEFHDAACYLANKYGYRPTEVQVVQTSINGNRLFYCKTYEFAAGKAMDFETAIAEFEKELIKHKGNATTISKTKRK